MNHEEAPENLSTKEAIEQMLKESNATEDVRNLVPLMGRQVFMQLAFPVPVFERRGTQWSPTNQAAQFFSGIIQPSPISDRVLIMMPGNTGAFVRAKDVQAFYIPLEPEQSKRIIM